MSSCSHISTSLRASHVIMFSHFNFTARESYSSSCSHMSTSTRARCISSLDSQCVLACKDDCIQDKHTRPAQPRQISRDTCGTSCSSSLRASRVQSSCQHHHVLTSQLHCARVECDHHVHHHVITSQLHCARVIIICSWDIMVIAKNWVTPPPPPNL
jgi:hypothetical protein